VGGAILTSDIALKQRNQTPELSIHYHVKGYHIYHQGCTTKQSIS